jgi:hypothetical protein
MRWFMLRCCPIVVFLEVDAYACGGWLTEVTFTDYSYVVLPRPRQ